MGASSGIGENGHSLLLIEDHADTRDALVMLLDAARCGVIAVARPDDALIVTYVTPPCLIVLDYTTAPGALTATEFARMRRDMPCLAHVPIVLISGYDDLETRAAEIGAVAWAQKPFDVDDVLACVGRYCGVSHLAASTG